MVFVIAQGPWTETTHDFQCIADEDKRLQPASSFTIGVIWERRKWSTTTGFN